MEALWAMGLSSRFRGYVAILEAMNYFLENPENRNQIINTYITVGNRLNTSWRNIERNVRTAVKRGWKNNRPYMEKIMGCDLPRPPEAGRFLQMLFVFQSAPGNSLISATSQIAP